MKQTPQSPQLHAAQIQAPRPPAPDAGGPGAGPTVLSLNSGSSSLKFSLYRVDSGALQILLSGSAEGIGAPGSVFSVTGADRQVLVSDHAAIADQGAAVARIGAVLDTLALPAPTVVGHRVVHGGASLRQHCIIDAAVMQAIRAAAVFAPLHAPPALAVIDFAQRHFPAATQVACFDTVFHATLPALAQTLPLPAELRDQGVRRYGFHGLSCESILQQLPRHLLQLPIPTAIRQAPERLVIAHLGSGASVSAVLDGRSIDTSMGLTPTGGVIMGTRSGDLDPGVLLYLLREKGYTPDRLEDLLDHHCGLRGISGGTSDMRSLQQAAPGNAQARLAIDMFCHSVAKQIAAMAVALGGIGLLIFTGGIGEHDAAVRAQICAHLRWLGVRIDPARNDATENPLEAGDARCAIRILESREDEQIARHAWALAGAV